MPARAASVELPFVRHARPNQPEIPSSTRRRARITPSPIHKEMNMRTQLTSSAVIVFDPVVVSSPPQRKRD